jgi:ubiquitin C-terminal hydrolase
MAALVLSPQPSPGLFHRDFEEEELSIASSRAPSTATDADRTSMDTNTTVTTNITASPPTQQQESAGNDAPPDLVDLEASECTLMDQMVVEEGLLEAPEEEEAAARSASPRPASSASVDNDVEATTSAGQTPGGISNLMNTCYMASALQMLASGEAFCQAIRESGAGPTTSPLCQALLTLWQDLAKGETVRPEDFKRAVDGRSCLFEGYEQQDAHEFLTTVLDLLDEDYKKAAGAEEAVDAVIENVTPPTSPMSTQAATESATNDTDDMDTDESPSCKRMKTCLPEEEEARPTTTGGENDTTAPSSTQSYSELDFGQIEQLLHGPSSREGVILPAAATTTQPVSCRLVGGRMNPTPNTFWAGQSLAAAESSSREQQQHQEEEEHSNRAPSQAASVERVTPTPAQVSAAANSDSTSDATSEQGGMTSCSSPVDDYFTTKVRARLTCDSCKYTRTHEETYLHWSLEMAGDNTSVDEVVRRFFAPERREVKCEKCFGESATQCSQILQLPKMLLLHFKRFVVNVSPDYSSVSYEKNSSAVAFGPVIQAHDFEDLVAPDCPLAADQPYRLRSVVNHLGSSVSFGHYMADAHRRVKDDGSREWLRFNDDHVSEISEQEAVQESFRTAYLVLYERE